MATINAIGTGKPISVSFGGTGAATLTDHGVLIGSSTAAVTPLAVGTDTQILIGNTGADPSWTANPVMGDVSADSFETSDVAAGLTIYGDNIEADGTDANIDINITAKGTGAVIIDELAIDTDLAVAYGGTGASTLTDHGVLIGSGTAAITPLAVGTNGQLLVGSTGADPVFATVASADASIEITGGAGTVDLSATGIVTINNQVGVAYELVAADSGKLVTCNNAAAIALTIPVNADVAMAIGTTVLISQLGAGVVTLTPEAGVTLSSRGALLDTAGQYAVTSITKILTDVWLVGGDVA